MALCSKDFPPFLFAAVLLLVCALGLLVEGTFDGSNPPGDVESLPSPYMYPCSPYWPCMPQYPWGWQPQEGPPPPGGTGASGTPPPASPRPPPSPPPPMTPNNRNTARPDGVEHGKNTHSNVTSAVGWAFLAAALALQVVLGAYLVYQRRVLERFGVRLEKVPSVSPPPSPAGFAPYAAAAR